MAKRVLLTGCNGYLGSHILAQLLAQGYSVRGIVRSQAKADQVRKDFPKAEEFLDFGVVPDITASGAFDEVIIADPPFDAVVHTASPFLYKAAADNEKDFLLPAVKGKLFSSQSSFLFVLADLQSGRHRGDTKVN